MSIDSILGAVEHYRLPATYDDDSVDRLNHIYTVAILMVSAIFVSSKQYVGNPIECFFPDGEFALAKREYAKAYCWMKNTYVVQPDKPLPVDTHTRQMQEIAYYQWVHVILLLLAAMFKLPNQVWRMMSYSSGMDINQMASMIRSTQLMPQDKARDTMRQVAEYIAHWLDAHVNRKVKLRCWSKFLRLLASCLFCFGKEYGTYLTSLYLFIKLLYFLNSLLIFVIMHRIMGSWFVWMGYLLIPNLYTGFQELGADTNSSLPELAFFPKVTYCDFDMRQMNNIITYTIQCTLPINMFNEKIFACLWLWFWLVMVVNGVSFVFWIYKLCLSTCCWYESKPFPINIHLILNSHGQILTDQDSYLATQFGTKYLCRDGVFVLDVIQKNTNAVVMSELVCELWRTYKAKPYPTGPYAAKQYVGKGDNNVMYI